MSDVVFIPCATSRVGLKVSYCTLFTMISCYFASINRHSSQAMCQVFLRTSFSRVFDGLRTSSRITMTEPKCLFGVHDDRYASQHRLAIYNLTGSNNPSNGIQNVFRDTNNPSNGIKHVFRDTNNSSNGTKLVFRDTNKPSNGTRNLLSETYVFLRGTKNVFQDTRFPFGNNYEQ